MSKNTYKGIDQELVKIVKRTAQRAIGKAGFTRNDLPDIEQELMIAALDGLKRRKKSVDNETAFATAIVNKQLKLIFRKENRKSKKWHRRRISLNISVELDSGDLDELINLVDTERLLRNNSYTVPDPYRDIDLTGNIDALIETLPENFRELCAELKQKSIHELARKKRVVRREISQLRQELEKQEVLSFFLQ